MPSAPRTSQPLSALLNVSTKEQINRLRLDYKIIRITCVQSKNDMWLPYIVCTKQFGTLTHLNTFINILLVTNFKLLCLDC